MAGGFVNSIDVLGDEAVLKSLITRNIVEYKDNMILNVGSNAFTYCYYLEIIDLPNVETIGMSAFNNCTALVSINVPKLKSVPTMGFASCRFDSITIPNVATIYSNGFNDCINLTKIDLYNINAIYANAFQNSKLNSLIIRRDDAICTLRSTSAFEGTPIFNGDGYIYVPKSMVDSYKQATNWSTLGNQIRAIEDYPEICG